MEFAKSVNYKRTLSITEEEEDELMMCSPSLRKYKMDQAELLDENSSDSGFSEPCIPVARPEFNLDSPFSLFANKSKSRCVRSLRIKSKSFDVNTNKHDMFNEEIIKEALDKDASEMQQQTTNKLIGDLSRVHSLPTLKKSRHQDLASISAETLKNLMNGSYSSQIGKFMILDARYPYEYEGGHIDGAESAYAKDKLFAKLFENGPITDENGLPCVLIFHCEFSAQRGPKLMREVRERDRLVNRDNYPNLYYPELYLLEGGYKSFFESNNDMCSPKNYLPMLHDNHRNDMKFFRRKNKTWELENRDKLAYAALDDETHSPVRKSSSCLTRTKLNF